MSKKGVRVDTTDGPEGIGATIEIYGATYSPDLLDDACRRLEQLVRNIAGITADDDTDVDAVCAAEDGFAQIRAGYDRTSTTHPDSEGIDA